MLRICAHIHGVVWGVGSLLSLALDPCSIIALNCCVGMPSAPKCGCAVCFCFYPGLSTSSFRNVRLNSLITEAEGGVAACAVFPVYLLDLLLQRHSCAFEVRN